MITFFSTPRPFRGPFDTIQRNAIKSWIKVFSGCEIILFEDEEKTTCAVARELGIKCITNIERDEFGTSLLSDVFKKVKEAAKFKIIVHVNSDIILMDDFLRAIAQVLDILKDRPFFMSGRRWDLDIKEPIDFDKNNWQEELKEIAKNKGKMCALSGMDYWILPLDFPFEIPPFIIGRPGMDSWLVYKSRYVGIPVIDSTAVVNAIHQNHNYPNAKKDFFEIEKSRNIKIAGGLMNMFTLREANFILTNRGLERPKFPRSIFANMALFYPWRFFLLLKRKINYLIREWQNN